MSDGILMNIESGKNPVEYKHLTMKELMEGISEMMHRPSEEPRVVRLYTGVRGLWHFNWEVRRQGGNITDYMVQHHAKLLRILPGKREVIDVNGQIWFWEIHDGRIWWVNAYAATSQEKAIPPTNIRFRTWQLLVEYKISSRGKHLEVPNLSGAHTHAGYMQWAQKRYQRHLRKKEGINRTPYSQAPYGC